MTERIVFSVPGLAPRATSPNSRVHYLTRHTEGKAYGETVLLVAQSQIPGHCTVPHHECPGKLPWDRAHVTLTQYAVKLRDHDNFAASFKPGLDALVKAGIIEDDKPTVIDLSLRAVKVAHKADERVLVEILRLSPSETP